MEQEQYTMAKAKQTVTTEVRRKKYGEGTAYEKCSNCGGDGVVRKRKKK